MHEQSLCLTSVFGFQETEIRSFSGNLEIQEGRDRQSFFRLLAKILVADAMSADSLGNRLLPGTNIAGLSAHVDY